MNETAAKPQLLKLFLILIVFLVLAFYLLIAATRGDLFWFKQGVDGRPTELRFYYYGSITRLHEGDKGFNELVDAATQEIPKINAKPEGGPSADTINHVRHNCIALELQYSSPTTIHSTFALGNPDTILIPVDGTDCWEARNRFFYLARNDIFGAWQPVFPPTSLEHIRDTMKGLGLYKS